MTRFSSLSTLLLAGQIAKKARQRLAYFSCSSPCESAKDFRSERRGREEEGVTGFDNGGSLSTTRGKGRQIERTEEYVYSRGLDLRGKSRGEVQ